MSSQFTIILPKKAYQCIIFFCLLNDISLYKVILKLTKQNKEEKSPCLSG